MSITPIDAHTPSARHARTDSMYRARARASRTSLLLIVLALLLPTSAGGAENAAANYRMATPTFADGSPLNGCRSWSGDADDAGRSYVGCPGSDRPWIYEFDAEGVVRQAAALPTAYRFDGAYRMRDVAVTPDGSTLYVSVGPIQDQMDPAFVVRNGSAYAGSVLRMRRQVDGSWAFDPGFRSGPWLFRTAEGDKYWAARHIDVDAAGRLYAAVNAFVYQIDPVTGAVASSFGGGTTNGPGGRWIEGLEVVESMAVSADGSSMYVVEERHHLVQRWVRSAAGDWVRDPGFLLGRPDDVGDQYCSTNDHFQAPYDVAVDVAGDVYVADVSCRRIQRFTSAGAFVQTVWSNGPDGELNHGFAMTWQGTFILPELERRLVRLDPPVRPAPTPPVEAGGPACTDRAAPRITAVTAPARSSARMVTISVTATDDCSGIRSMRVTGARLGAARWISGASQRVSLDGWNGSHRLLLQVRDGAGRVSSIATRSVTLALPQPMLRARSSTRIAGSGCSSVSPMSRVAPGSGYRVIERCARFAGKVLAVRGGAVQLALRTATARLLYVNAVGPVTIWVVPDARTRRRGRPARGRTLTVLATLVAQRDQRAVHAIPVDAITT